MFYSSKSADLVKEVISFVKPQVVFLELCPKRVGALTSRQVKVPTVIEMVNLWSRKTPLLLILLSYFYAKIACELKVIPGDEFRVAYEEATKYGGRVFLGDRPIQITLRRLCDKASLLKLVSSLISQSDSLPDLESTIPKLLNLIEDNIDLDEITSAIQQMSKLFPSFVEVLVHERDKGMSSELLRVASKHNSVVAVVGKLHLPGIKMNWMQYNQVRALLDTSE